MSTTLIQLFAKAPILNQVKTRMQPTLSAQQALELHCELTKAVCEQLCESRLGRVELWVGSHPDDLLFRDLSEKYGISVCTQCAGDLGERMASSSKAGIELYDNVILVGADCPFIDRGYLQKAIESLFEYDAVIGPAQDGGYVLLGLRQWHKKLFSEIDWGTGKVRHQTIQRLNELSWSYYELETQIDIDRPEDLSELKNTPRPAIFQKFYQ